MDEELTPVERRRALLEDLIAELDAVHAGVLFWMMRGAGDEQIADELFKAGIIKDKWKAPSIVARRTELYRDLGYPTDMHKDIKRPLFEFECFPIIKLLTNNDPDKIREFPLRNKVIETALPVSEKPIEQPVEQEFKEERHLEQPVDQKPEPKPTPAPSRSGILVGIALIAALLTIAYFAFFRNLLQAPAPTETVAPTLTSLPTNNVLPTDTLQPILPTDTEMPTNTPPPTPKSEPTFTPDATVLFEDDFDGEMKEVWKSPLSGDVPIITGDDRWLTFRGPTQFVLGDATWTNYEVSLSMTNLYCQGGVSSNTITIGLRYQPSGEMIAFRWLHWENNCVPVWLQGRQGQWSVLAQDIFPLPPKNESGSRRITISAQGDNFQTSFGGLITVSGFPNGGVVLIADDGVMIDNLVIRALP